MGSSNKFRETLKTAKRRLASGDFRSAIILLSRASEYTQDPNPIHRYPRGIVLHQYALNVAELGDIHGAQHLFEAALAQIKSDDPIARAILLRDFGNFELRQNNVVTARRRITAALRLLDRIVEVTPRVEIEQIVTRGFLARTNIESDPVGSLEILRELAARLQGYKSNYELDNLDWLIDYLPLSYERQRLTLRAMYLCASVGNQKRAGEFGALLGGGKPLRGLYRFVL
ncbi:MAG: hypothetical protein JWM00_320 [Candidatus Saccharibacteria bacterium]|nr:hypothetical protein [Candidatus Saccharibacteria bacterium]